MNPRSLTLIRGRGACPGQTEERHSPAWGLPVWVVENWSCPQPPPPGPRAALLSHPCPDSCHQNKQSYEKVMKGSLGAASAISEIIAVSVGDSQGSVPSWHGPDEQRGREGARPWQVTGTDVGGKRASALSVAFPWESMPHLPQSESPLWTGSPQLPAVQMVKPWQDRPLGPTGIPGQLRKWAGAGPQGEQQQQYQHQHQHQHLL